jgi:hypothetical protein
MININNNQPITKKKEKMDGERWGGESGFHSFDDSTCKQIITCMAPWWKKQSYGDKPGQL